MNIDFKSLSLFKIIALVLVGLCFIMIFLPWVTTLGFSCNMFQLFPAWLSVIFMILLVAAMALAVLGILLDRNLLVMPFAALTLLMLLVDVIYVFSMKRNTYFATVGIGAGLFGIFGLAAYAALFYEDVQLERNPFDFNQFKFSELPIPAVNLGGVGGWVCPNCGAKMGGSQNFCTSCGSRKPEPPRCPNCGAVAKPGESFCSNCGTRL